MSSKAARVAAFWRDSGNVDAARQAEERPNITEHLGVQRNALGSDYYYVLLKAIKSERSLPNCD